ncbi:hypothetical protein D9V87_05490 [Bacteroidetes/Chlorobi group bacterium MS-B_bin-24]|jgi:hypothetical protein|nr:MAG: hypothetical protein D9V87_05490 [Bacteroidetes/Chlorobi group bacterium MS-B_bin-24]
MSGERYHIQIATDPNFQYLVKDTSNIIDTFYVYTSQLLPGKLIFGEFVLSEKIVPVVGQKLKDLRLFTNEFLSFRHWIAHSICQ